MVARIALCNIAFGAPFGSPTVEVFLDDSSEAVPLEHWHFILVLTPCDYSFIHNHLFD